MRKRRRNIWMLLKSLRFDIVFIDRYIISLYREDSAEPAVGILYMGKCKRRQVGDIFRRFRYTETLVWIKMIMKT